MNNDPLINALEKLATALSSLTAELRREQERSAAEMEKAQRGLSACADSLTELVTAMRENG